MITPTNSDVGRRVRYNRRVHTGDTPPTPEYGVLTSLGVRPGWAFVRYDDQPADARGQSTPCDCLTFAD